MNTKVRQKEELKVIQGLSVVFSFSPGGIGWRRAGSSTTHFNTRLYNADLVTRPSRACMPVALQEKKEKASNCWLGSKLSRQDQTLVGGGKNDHFLDC